MQRGYRRPRLLQPVRGVRLPALAVLAAMLAFAACASSSAAPSSSSLLQKSQTAFNNTTAFHFIMQTQHLGTVAPGNYNIISAKGDVVRPDKLSASATADAGFATADVNLIIVGKQEWITNPLTGKFASTDEFGSFLLIFDPHVGIGSLLTQIQHPSAATSGSANGTPCWKVSGTLSPDKLKPLFQDVTTTQPVPTTVCIGKSDNQLDSVTFNGVVTNGDTTQTTRTFYLSNFDKPVTITTPAAGS